MIRERRILRGPLAGMVGGLVAIGTKDKPRIPIFLGFRDRRDML